MRAIFIRHGQSTGNAGKPCHDLAQLEPYSTLKHTWPEPPSRIWPGSFRPAPRQGCLRPRSRSGAARP